MRSRYLQRVVMAAILSNVLVLAYAQASRQQCVSFKAGSSSASVSGTVKGDDFVDYVLNAKAGQTMTVALKTSNGANYFNVLPPGSDAAIAIGADVGQEWSGTLPAYGDYKIRVCLMGGAERRHATAKYVLTVGITGKPGAAAGSRYSATGKVPCSVGTDPAGSAQCSFGVIRGGPDKPTFTSLRPALT